MKSSRLHSSWKRPFPAIGLAVLVGLAGLAGLASTAAAQYGPNVEIVTATQGNPIASCSSLLSALAGITTSSASNRFLVKLGPGEYDCGSQTLAMKEYVDIEGAGIEVTKILGQGVTTPMSGDPDPLFTGADHAELRGMSLSIDGTAGKSATAIRAFGTSPRITSMKIELDGADHCVAIDSVGDPGDPNADPPVPAGSLATPYLRQLELHVQCEMNNTGVRIKGRANPVIQRDYIKAVHGTESNVGILVEMEGVDKMISKEARDVIISVYGPSGNGDSATAFGMQFLPGSGEHEELNVYGLFNSYIHAGNAETNRGISLEGGADGSPLKPKLNVYKSQIIAIEDFGVWVRGATLILHSSVVESGSGEGDAEISAETQPGATATKSTVRVGATHLRQGTVVKDAASSVHCAFAYSKTFAEVTCPG